MSRLELEMLKCVPAKGYWINKQKNTEGALPKVIFGRATCKLWGGSE
jgi:hypothetical protein